MRAPAARATARSGRHARGRGDRRAATKSARSRNSRPSAGRRRAPSGSRGRGPKRRRHRRRWRRRPLRGAAAPRALPPRRSRSRIASGSGYRAAGGSRPARPGHGLRGPSSGQSKKPPPCAPPASPGFDQARERRLGERAAEPRFEAVGARLPGLREIERDARLVEHRPAARSRGHWRSPRPRWTRPRRLRRHRDGLVEIGGEHAGREKAGPSRTTTGRLPTLAHKRQARAAAISAAVCGLRRPRPAASARPAKRNAGRGSGTDRAARRASPPIERPEVLRREDGLRRRALDRAPERRSSSRGPPARSRSRGRSRAGLRRHRRRSTLREDAPPRPPRRGDRARPAGQRRD